MKNWWLSWYWPDELGGFELHSPWWISGYKIEGPIDDPSCGDACICAAVQADTEEEAMGKVIASFDKKPSAMEWRFCEEHPPDWSPFSGRFPHAKWMKWEKLAA